MGLLSLTLPTIGQPNSTEDSKVRDALSAIQSEINGNIELTNIHADLQELLIPTATVLPYGGTAAPSGFLMCDGSAISRTTYSALFTKIGETFGVGDGSTTFNIPDLRGRTIVGEDGAAGRLSANDALGDTGGEATHLLTAAESGLRDHSHLQGYPVPTNQGFTGGNSINAGAIGSFNTGNVSGGIADAPALLAHNNMQPYQILNHIIKT